MSDTSYSLQGELNTSYLSYNSNISSGTKDKYSIKICLIGDIFVGKTCLFHQYSEGKFSSKYTSSISCQSKIKEINLDQETKVSLQVWDTCGEEKFRSITQQYYRSADGIILLFDLTEMQTFLHLEQWLKEIKRYCKEDVQLFLAGNKMDLQNEKQVPQYEIQNFIEKHNMRYESVSAKIGTNVSLVFEELADKCVKILKEQPSKEDSSNFVGHGSKITFNVTESLKRELNRKNEKEVRCC